MNNISFCTIIKKISLWSFWKCLEKEEKNNKLKDFNEAKQAVGDNVDLNEKYENLVKKINDLKDFAKKTNKLEELKENIHNMEIDDARL